MSSEKPLAPANANDTAFFGHPRGLSTLFFTELWERFSYYGMRALLILFLTEKVTDGGFGMTAATAGIIYGVYTGMVYLVSLPGGWIADRFLGQQKAVFYGGVLIFLGHVCLAIPLGNAFFVGLVLIVLGTGLLKPNVSTIVGQLYGADDPRRDSGFSIYYMGINIGAFIAPLVCGFLAQSAWFRELIASWGMQPETAWHFGFGAAAVGMLLGVIQFGLGLRNLGDAGRVPVPAETPEAAIRQRKLLLLVIAGCLGLPALIGGLHVAEVFVLDAGRVKIAMIILLAAVTVGLFGAMFLVGKWTSEERKRLVGIVCLFFGAAVFFGVFEQAGSSFNLIANEKTDNRVFGVAFPSSWFQAVNAMFIIILAPVFAALWTALKRRGIDPSFAGKFGVGMFLIAGGCLIMLPGAWSVEAGGLSAPYWLILLYLFHTMAELLVSPVGLSSTTKLAPARIAGLAMGIWFTGIAIGNYSAGYMAGLTESMALSKMVVVISIAPITIGVLFLVLSGPLKRMLGRSF